MSNDYTADDVELTIDGEPLTKVNPGRISLDDNSIVPAFGDLDTSTSFELELPVDELARAAAKEEHRRILKALASGDYLMVLSEDVAEDLNEQVEYPLFPYAYPGVWVAESLDEGTVWVVGGPIEIEAVDPWRLFEEERR